MLGTTDPKGEEGSLGLALGSKRKRFCVSVVFVSEMDRSSIG